MVFITNTMAFLLVKVKNLFQKSIKIKKQNYLY